MDDFLPETPGDERFRIVSGQQQKKQNEKVCRTAEKSSLEVGGPSLEIEKEKSGNRRTRKGDPEHGHHHG